MTLRRVGTAVILVLFAGGWQPALANEVEEAPAARCLVDAYLRALEGTMQAEATPEAVSRVVELLGEDSVYRHPRVGATINGRAEIAAGMERFLGSMQDGSISVESFIERNGTVSVNYSRHFMIENQGVREQRTIQQTSVFETKDGRIAAITDFW